MPVRGSRLGRWSRRNREVLITLRGGASERPKATHHDGSIRRGRGAGVTGRRGGPRRFRTSLGDRRYDARYQGPDGRARSRTFPRGPTPAPRPAAPGWGHVALRHNRQVGPSQSTTPTASVDEFERALWWVAAASNNAEFCDIVCRSTARSLRRYPRVDESARTPPYYPMQLRSFPVDFRAVSRIDCSRGCSIESTFAPVDLTVYRFQVALALHRPGRAS